MKKLHLIPLLLLSVSLSLSVNADWLTPDLLWKLGRVSDPRVSPDGSKVAFCIRKYDMATNKGNTDMWIYDFATNTSKAISADSSNESDPRWSGDGKRIYFLNDAGGSSQLWSMMADGSGKEQVSKVDGDIMAYGISGNEKMIWVAMEVELDKFLGKEKYTDLPKTTGRVYDDLMMRHWDQWADGKYNHIFIAPFDKGRIDAAVVDIMPGEKYDAPTKPFGGAEEIAWSPDGKLLAYTSIKSGGREYSMNTNSEIYLYDVSSKQTTNLTEGNKGYDKAPVFSPDGSKLAWVSWEEAGNEASLQRLFTIDLATKAQHNLTNGFEYNVENIVWPSGSDKLYFVSDINATDQVFSCSEAGGKVEQITHDTANYYSLTIASADGKLKLVAARMSMIYPTDVFEIDAKSGKGRQLTFVNKELLDPLTVPEIKQFMIKATDGKDILTWVVYPPNFNPANKYPTLLYCQGGPQSTVSQFFSYRWNLHLMAANGYIVVAPNRRGLPGFGKDWNDQISHDWGGQAMSDLLSAIDSMAKQPYVNKDRLGAVGASFGGYSVFWLEGNHQRRFKAFISHCGVFNLESMIATEELFFHLHEFDGVYWRSPVPVSYLKHSPHKYAANWDTPILIIANERDYRVPYTQGLEAYSVARLKNVPARFLSFPDEGHWVLKPQNGIMWQREFFGWLDKYLK